MSSKSVVDAAVDVSGAGAAAPAAAAAASAAGGGGRGGVMFLGLDYVHAIELST